MAVITANSLTGSGSKAMTVTTLGASDTFVYSPGARAVLYLNNVTGGALTPQIDGAGASTTFACAGILNQDLSAGYTLASIAAGDTVAINLDSISGYLKGVITIDGGTSIEATLINFV